MDTTDPTVEVEEPVGVGEPLVGEGVGGAMGGVGVGGVEVAGVEVGVEVGVGAVEQCLSSFDLIFLFLYISTF